MADNFFSGLPIPIVGAGGSAGSKWRWYKLGNKSLNKSQPSKVPVGVIVESGKLGEGLDAATVTIPFRAVIFGVFRTRQKSAAGNYKQIECRSFDGLHPASSIENPLCKQSSVEQLSQLLRSRKLHDATIATTVATCTDGQRLCMCGYRDPETGNIYPYCPQALEGKCKEKVMIYGRNLDRNENFIIEPSKSSLKATKDYSAPLVQFLNHTGVQKIPLHEWIVDFGTAIDDGVAHIHVENFRMQEDARLREELEELAFEVTETQRDKQSVVKPKEGEEAKTGFESTADIDSSEINI